jgi:nitrite reductase/ring-hydroxylating ferredoxin subunit
MKKIFFMLFILPFAIGCDGGSANNNNPNIPNYAVNLQINLNLPAYSNLQFPGNRIIDFSQGARGIVVFNTGSGFVAFDLACPNIAFTVCTTPMSVPQGSINATCDCDDTVYSLYTGQSAGQQYPMKAYRVNLNGSALIITN